MGLGAREGAVWAPPSYPPVVLIQAWHLQRSETLGRQGRPSSAVGALLCVSPPNHACVRGAPRNHVDVASSRPVVGAGAGRGGPGRDPTVLLRARADPEPVRVGRTMSGSPY